jgi:lipid-binding SYLF domain-containing protein
VNGSSIREDRDSNEEFYGQRFRTRQVVLDGQAKAPQSPEAVEQWLAALKAHIPDVR